MSILTDIRKIQKKSKQTDALYRTHVPKSKREGLSVNQVKVNRMKEYVSQKTGVSEKFNRALISHAVQGERLFAGPSDHKVETIQEDFGGNHEEKKI